MKTRSTFPGTFGLDGIPAAPGTTLGRARVVRDAADLARVLPGEVLVCATASAAWSAVFPRAAALVTDCGGALSQAAVLAREYGLPAVVATGSATDLVRDGDLVRVSGSAGLVEIVRRSGATSSSELEDDRCSKGRHDHGEGAGPRSRMGSLTAAAQPAVELALAAR